MKFFFDNNLSPRIARALSALEGLNGNHIEHLRDRFAAATADAEWIRELSKERDWYVISCDKSILKNPHEVRAWRETGLVIFFLREMWLHLGFWDQAWQLVKRWPQICDIASRSKNGEGFFVSIRKSQIEKV